MPGPVGGNFKWPEQDLSGPNLIHLAFTVVEACFFLNMRDLQADARFGPVQVSRKLNQITWVQSDGQGPTKGPR